MKNWEQYNFEMAARISPATDSTGGVEAFTPHTTYENPKNLPLHHYGEGPFCKFHIPSSYSEAGIYLMSVNGAAMYIGGCNSLSKCMNDGYGAITARDCYEGGQPVHCRVNHLIFEAVKAGEEIELWFFKIPERQTLGAEMLKTIRPPWNQKEAVPVLA